MGLDMYLNRRRYVQNWDHNPPEERTEVTLKVGGKDVPLTNVTYIEEQVAYWRKANQIHKWFVDTLAGGLDECQRISVTLEQLQSLVDQCKAVLAKPEDANAVLPTQGGFFFGGTEYDEAYTYDLQNTVDQLTPVLEQAKSEVQQDYHVELFYQASW